uniref:DUF4939 domain-containing protein n=1 Tax=Xenopus tropicalis TaxID=8364 RepID=A0A803K953_XENTR
QQGLSILLFHEFLFMEESEEISAMQLLTQQMATLTQAVQELQAGFQQVQAQLQPLPGDSDDVLAAPPPAVVLSSVTKLKLSLPERFSGDRKKFQAFMNTLVGFIISLLSGEPQTWAHRLLEQQSPLFSDSAAFFQAMAVLYDDPQREASAEVAGQMEDSF